MPSLPKATAQEFDSINAYIEAANDTLLEGHLPEMSALKEKISSLCAAILHADPEVQGECKTRLGDLLVKLSACEERLNSLKATAKFGGNK